MEIPKTVDQRRRELEKLLEDFRHVLAKSGSVVASWRTRSGRRTGPYFRLAYRIEGRQRSFYLGTDVELVHVAKAALQTLQTESRAVRQRQQLRKTICRQLTASRRAWDEELRKIGLRLKGSEVRGWSLWNRNSPRPLQPKESVYGSPDN